MTTPPGVEQQPPTGPQEWDTPVFEDVVAELGDPRHT